MNVYTIVASGINKNTGKPDVLMTRCFYLISSGSSEALKQVSRWFQMFPVEPVVYTYGGMEILSLAIAAAENLDENIVVLK
jgi:hypothetical protein